MERQQLEKIMSELSKQRRVFHSEADFQFSLSTKIREFASEYDVRLEVPRQIELIENKPELGYIDILLMTNQGKEIPIELKYRTKKLDFNDENYYNEQFNLKNHSAVDVGCYTGVKDIARIESLFLNNPNVEKGFTIFLSNDPSFWEKRESEANHDNFKLYQGKKFEQGNYDWLRKTKANSKFSAVDVYWEHEIDWRDYSKLDSQEFKYFITQVK